MYESVLGPLDLHCLRYPVFSRRQLSWTILIINKVQQFTHAKERRCDMSFQLHRVTRNYRNLAPTKFHVFNQRIKTSLVDKTRIPESIWAANMTLLQSYLSTSDKHDGVYHESLLGSKLLIAEREVLQAQLVIYLDEIASLLEMAAVRTPDILIGSGFDLQKERRGHSRAKATAAARNAAHAEQEEGESGTPA